MYVGFLLSISFHGTVASEEEYEEELWSDCT